MVVLVNTNLYIKIENDATNFFTLIRQTRLLNVIVTKKVHLVLESCTRICMYYVCVHVCRHARNYLYMHVYLRDVIPQIPPTIFCLFVFF